MKRIIDPQIMSIPGFDKNESETVGRIVTYQNPISGRISTGKIIGVSAKFLKVEVNRYIEHMVFHDEVLSIAEF